VAYSTLPRPDALSKYFDCATKVDDHDNARQDKLAVEGAWDTTCPWFRLHTSFVGICFTDMWKLCDAIGILPFHQRADRRMPIKKCLNMYTTGACAEAVGSARVCDAESNHLHKEARLHSEDAGCICGVPLYLQAGENVRPPLQQARGFLQQRQKKFIEALHTA
jgi:hypothetical protein